MTFETTTFTFLVVGAVTGVTAFSSVFGMYMASEGDNFYLFRGQSFIGLILSLVSVLSLTIFLHKAWSISNYQDWLPWVVVSLLILVLLIIANAVAFMKSG